MKTSGLPGARNGSLTESKCDINRLLPRDWTSDAIGEAQDTVIGMASSAPGVSVGLTLAALAAAMAYGSGPGIILTAVRCWSSRTLSGG